ncbi:hypothetical protein [Desulfotomaculum copahuensis]|uniref:Stage III sporulation protein AG n=1 Tax=Desulfotomaculum copahuensis TaxID=1838280 RepID=A0A1B7LJ08_9FIRM|nr:hypothetical protein [Desulfotomaculum copahuensis]OAT86536.1 hypothetical protein A6M21_03770 [Desulfotomaculum copahuensis]
MSWWDKLTAHGDGQNLPPKLQKRTFWWLAGLAALGVVLLLLGNTGHHDPAGKAPGTGGAAPAPVTQKVQPSVSGDSSMGREEVALEDKLQQVLSQVAGAGRVDVTVRLASSQSEDYAVNASTTRKTTQEKDQSGGTRVTTENTDTGQMVLLRENQGDTPVVRQEQAARIAGVLVVAAGAQDPQVKARLFEAVRVALGVEPQKILVLPMEGGS